MEPQPSTEPPQQRPPEDSPAPTAAAMEPVEVTVTLQSDVLGWAREQAERQGRSVSAVVAEALLQRRQAEAWAEYLEWALEGQPPLTPEELEAAEQEWKG